jgi:ABC-2 type transport system ATP-binding protein
VGIMLVVVIIAGLVWLVRRNRGGRPAKSGGPERYPAAAEPYQPTVISEDERALGLVVVSGLTKAYDGVTVVDDVSFTAEPGRVTGFLGPNGAGKTTTLRMLLGLVAPTSGWATIGDVRYEEIAEPARRVGAVLEASGAHEARTGREHLRIIAMAAGLPPDRVSTTLAAVGLASAAGRPVRGYSLGMRQRLGVAAALLGDPRVLILDEPGNGLDPEGIRWIRQLLRRLAAEGRTVLVSSHQLAEIEQLADDLIVIAAGRVVAQGTVASVIGERPSLEDAFLELTAGKEAIR